MEAIYRKGKSGKQAGIRATIQKIGRRAATISVCILLLLFLLLNGCNNYLKKKLNILCVFQASNKVGVQDK